MEILVKLLRKIYKKSKNLILLYCLSLDVMSVQTDDSLGVTIKRLTLEPANKVAM